VSPAPRLRALGALAVAALLSALWLLWLLSYGVAHCRLTTDRSLLASANAVVFHHRELQTRQTRLPLAERPQGQPWVWASMESPSHTRGLGRLRGVFNWVLSYRRDSDIFNSQHRDYITEKFWRNALLAGTVPVVLGPSRVTYEAFAPPDAFVHVDDFGSAHELAAFLAGMNESRYQRYFAWRDRFRVRLFGDWRERFCAICARYPHLPPGQVYQDLEGWFQA
ncbi:hypothetical protein E2I00_003343, partial [Balaenoptera physalus]